MAADAHCLELQEEMLGRLERGSARFGDLVGATAMPVVARAHALHLLRWRRIGFDLASPLRDSSVVALAIRPPW
ncbi:hypothetical protein [Kitasatospora sp. NBC_00315]|uniref:hypothetical protein n=1 Tax=Kitasatospora sp. NBC_00315 TaxID=2975963 RepID=UPI00324C62E1